MNTKICFICNTEKNLSDYYVHKKMLDGHLNKCKECTKKHSKERFEKLKENSEWLEKEKKRAREKYYRLDYKTKHKPTLEQKKITQQRYKEKYPEKYIAKQATQKIPKKNGYHLHHWSYNNEHAKDVIELTIKEHSLAHRFIVYDQERMMYRRIDTMELLDTKEKHENFIKNIKE